MDSLSALYTGQAAFLSGFMASMGALVFIIPVVWYILEIIANWKIFTKAGKAGWLSIIPIVNTWNLFDLSWSRVMAWVMVALSCGVTLFRSPSDGERVSTLVVVLGTILGLALIIISIIQLYKLAKAYGKGFGFFLGLLFLNPIFMLILGFDSSTYQGRQ